jgi:ATP-dependent Lon protease
VPFDLSKTLFVLTANITDTIPPALLDRMEVMYLEGYNEQEKLLIAKKYLIPKQLDAKGLKKGQVHLSDSAISKIIRDYTREAGVRELERTIGVIFGKVAMKIVEKGVKNASITEDNLEKYLGVEKFFYDVKKTHDEVGVATGLAWTESGGDVIFVETAKMVGSKGLILTGQLGSVMKESAKAALSYIRSNAKKFGIKPDFFEKSDIHIHVPEGAIPKDGPSAGITIATALVSLLTERKVIRDVAMTGEITLTGKVLAIGGLKAKILAAQRAGVRTVIIPEQNRNKLEEIPARFKKGLKFVFAKKIDDALKAALMPKVVKKEK